MAFTLFDLCAVGSNRARAVSMSPLAAAACGLALSGVWLFNFLYYVPRSVLLQRMSTSAGRRHLLMQSLKWGFLKSSFRNFVRFCRRNLTLARRDRVAVGRPCIDAPVVDLSGNVRSLTGDYIVGSGSVPLVLNVGSYS